MYIVKAFMGSKKGWQEIKRFDNATDAEFWIAAYARLNGYTVYDFRIVVK